MRERILILIFIALAVSVAYAADYSGTATNAELDHVHGVTSAIQTQFSSGTAALGAHTGNTSNPHSVTAAQVSAPTLTVFSNYTTSANAAINGKEPTQTAASQAEAEAGTEAAIRSFSPQRVFQAIAALGGDITSVLGDTSGAVPYLYQTWTAFGAGDTTPDVSAAMQYKTVDTTTITGFDHGGGAITDGRHLIVECGAATVFDLTSSEITAPNRTSDYTCTAGVVLEFVYDTDQWYALNIPDAITTVADPNADRGYFWDDSETAPGLWTPVAPLEFSGTNFQIAAAPVFTTSAEAPFFVVGSAATAADAGGIRLPNASYIMAEADAAGTDISVIGVDSSEVVQIGASGASGVTITPATTITGNLTVNGGSLTVANVTNDNHLKLTDNAGGRAPTASSYELYPDAGVWKLNQNGTEYAAVLSPTAGQVSFTGPSTARAFVLPDAAATILTTNAAVTPAQGGTGVANNASSTWTISGAFGTTVTVSATTGITLPPVSAGTVDTHCTATHDYGGAAVAWTMTAAEAACTYVTATNANGAVDAVLPAATPGKTYTVNNATGQVLTFKVTGQTGGTIANAKWGFYTTLAADVAEIYELP